MKLLCFVGAVLAAGSVFAQSAPPEPILPDSLKWQGNPTIKGAESAWVVGTADRQGLYAQRVRLAQGAMISPHTHGDERMSVVLSGTMYVGFGEKVDEKSVVAIPVGGVYVAPAGVPHYVWAKDGPIEYQEAGMGPTTTQFVPAK